MLRHQGCFAESVGLDIARDEITVLICISSSLDDFAITQKCTPSLFHPKFSTIFIIFLC